MECVKVCRVCLAMDVKLFSLQGPLGNNYKFLIGEHMISSGSLPHYACYECTELIRKSTAFKEKCLRAQMALCNILRNNKITEYEIKLIDRDTMKLQSHLSIYSIPSEDLYQPPIEEVQIKEECTDLEMIVEEGGKAVDAGNEDMMYDDDDDLPLKYVSAKKQRKMAKKQKYTTNGKKGRLKDKLKTRDMNIASKPESKDIAKDDILKYFVVTKLSMEEQKAEILKRRDCANYRDSPFKCDACYKGFLVEGTLRNHLARHDTSAGDIVCGVCGFRFWTRRAHGLHAARHARRYACRACAFLTVHADQAKKHKAWHDGVTYRCQYCNEVSTKLTSYLSHVRVKHPSRWVCAQCGYSFVSERGLKMHRARMHHSQQEEKSSEPDNEADSARASRLYCGQCGVRFASEEALKRHTVTSAAHRDRLGSGCRECGEVLPSAGALRAHRRAHAHSLPARRALARARYVPRARAPTTYPMQCEHCEVIIPHRSGHWKHYQRCHHGEKYPLSPTNYICEICGKGFQVNAFLTHHLRAHSTERPPRTPRAPAAARRGRAVTTKLGLQHLKSDAGAGELPQRRGAHSRAAQPLAGGNMTSGPLVSTVMRCH